MKHLAIVEVCFIDAETRDPWADHDIAVRDATVDTMDAYAVGYLIAETDDRIVIASMANAKQYASIINVPKAAIRSRRTIRKAVKR